MVPSSIMHKKMRKNFVNFYLISYMASEFLIREQRFLGDDYICEGEVIYYKVVLWKWNSKVKRKILASSSILLHLYW